jgi:hypothetical protein
MSKRHYGALGAVIAGYVLGRILAFAVVDAVGALTDHQRSSGTAIGAAGAAIPFIALVIFTFLALRAPELLTHTRVKVVFLVGWFFGGGVMGMLPWSRMGLEMHLRLKEAHTAPGFLHGIDVTIGVGLVVTVGLLFAALRARHQPPTAPIEWIEHQFEDEP